MMPSQVTETRPENLVTMRLDVARFSNYLLGQGLQLV